MYGGQPLGPFDNNSSEFYVCNNLYVISISFVDLEIDIYVKLLADYDSLLFVVCRV